MRPRKLPGPAALTLIAACGFASPVAAQPTVEFFPGERIYPVYRADALAHQFSLTRVTNNTEWIGAIGGSLPLVEVAAGDCAGQWGVGASVFNRIIKTPGHITVYTVDYKIDFPIDLKLPIFALRLAFGHISNHYADDGIEILGLRSISAVKDYVQLAFARGIPLIGGTGYAGVVYNYHNEPILDKRWAVQFGGDFGNWRLTSWATVYGAVDFKIKEEVGWGSTQSYQAGVVLVPRGSYDFRVAYTHRTGYEERGQVYDRSTANDLITLFLDF